MKFKGLGSVDVEGRGHVYAVELTEHYESAEALRAALIGERVEVLIGSRYAWGTISAVELDARGGPWKPGDRAGIVLVHTKEGAG